MRKFGTALGALLAAGMVTVGSPASATVATITYTGTLYNTFDGSGILPGSTQDGDPFTLVYTLDTSVGQIESGCNQLFCYNYIGSDSPYGHPVIGKLTIPGLIFLFTGNAGGFDAAEKHTICGNSSICSDQIQTLHQSDGSFVSSGVESTDFTIPLNLTTPYSIALGGSKTYSAGGQYSITTYSGVITGSFDVTKVSLAPEPSAWAMMLLGFAGLGAAVRRRRAITA